MHFNVWKRNNVIYCIIRLCLDKIIYLMLIGHINNYFAYESSYKKGENGNYDIYKCNEMLIIIQLISKNVLKNYHNNNERKPSSEDYYQAVAFEIKFTAKKYLLAPLHDCQLSWKQANVTRSTIFTFVTRRICIFIAHHTKFMEMSAVHMLFIFKNINLSKHLMYDFY